MKEVIKNKNKLKVKKENSFSNNLEVAKKIRAKRDLLDYKGIRMERW